MSEASRLAHAFLHRFRTFGIKMIQTIESTFGIICAGPIFYYLVSFLELFPAPSAVNGYSEVSIGKNASFG